MQSVFEQDLERLVKQYDQPGPRTPVIPRFRSGPREVSAGNMPKHWKQKELRTGGFQSIFTFRSAERFAPFADATKSSPGI